MNGFPSGLRSYPAPAKRVLHLTTHEALGWTLRIGVFLCFVGHGAFGLMTKEGWLPFFGFAGIGPGSAYRLMPIIGTGDVLLGTLALVQPRAALLIYMIVWSIWTAALRPLTGQPIWEMFERAGNYGVPIALLVMSGASRDLRSWAMPAPMRSLTPDVTSRLRGVLTITTALLLVGHGVLAIEQKQELVAHYGVLASIFGGGVLSGAALATMFGAMEIALAAAVLWRPSVSLCLFLFVWKLLTELLFLASGAPVWEVVERGGSYTAPLALAMVLIYSREASRSSGGIT